MASREHQQATDRVRRDILGQLHDYVQARPRPEDVADFLLHRTGIRWGKQERGLLESVAKLSVRMSLCGFSSMAADFVRPDGAEHQVKVASELFAVEPLTSEECLDAERVRKFVEEVGHEIGKVYGQNDFLRQRLNREQREEAGVTRGHRAYNKRWRLLKRMEGKVERMVRERQKYELRRASKSALATQISREDLGDDLMTACFLAYYTARQNRRSVFTCYSQSRAFDGVGEMLLRRCRGSATTRWDLIAMAYPEKQVLERLTDEQKGRLIGRVWNMLGKAAGMLEEMARTTSFDRAEMTVSRGNDSSTWNEVAGAWNNLREQWVGVLCALGYDHVLGQLCPGKVMRLMAADVTRWHRQMGGDVHPDTKVWAELPPPWEVIAGRATCTREMVERACWKHGVDPATWVEAKRKTRAEKFTPTPELVHGVQVNSPELALALRRAGVFSGKDAHNPGVAYTVVRDEHGAAVLAEPD